MQESSRGHEIQIVASVEWDCRRRARLVEGDDEGGLPLFEQVDGLDGLRLEPVHEVHHQDGNVAQAAAAGAQVGERLVTCAPPPHPGIPRFGWVAIP